MRTHLLAVGKLRSCYRDACDDYLRRLTRYGAVEEVEIREATRAATPVLRRRQETERLAAAIPPRAQVIALEIGGAQITSEQLAGRLDGWRQGALPVALVVGGAYGMESGLLPRAVFRWSLSPLTLPHELARVIVLEQWYRAWTILRGEPYHKGG